MFAASKTASVSGGYQISRSLRFNSADSAYLNRTPASAGNRRTWTWSGWVKASAFSFQSLFGASDGTNYCEIYFGGNLGFDFYGGGARSLTYSTASFRDPSAWYHIVIAIDTTQATDSNRVKAYVNGVEVLLPTVDSGNRWPLQNADGGVNTTSAHNLGRRSNASSYFNGYMTEVNFIDGQALTPSSFGETNAQTGVWQPKAYSGSYGTNGFYLNFSDNSNTTAATLGKDYSGNGNNWTPNNFSVTAGAGNDSLVDSPTSYGTDTGVGGEVRGNYATLNPIALVSGYGTIANGNLDYTGPTGYGISSATIGMSSGKWYFEMTATSAGVGCGVSLNSALATQYLGQNASGWSYFDDGNKYNNNSGSAYGATFTTGDVIGVAFDADAGTLVFYKNGTSQGTAFSSLTSGPYFFTVSDGSSPQQRTCSANFGQRPFAYTAPSGFKALCTQNLPTPTIGATTATQANTFFAPALYTGNDGTQTVTTGIDMATSGGLVWFKNRSAAVGHALINPVVGYGSFLQSNTTGAENAFSFITATSSTGFTMNTGSSTFNGGAAAGGPFAYVAWNWKANGSGSTNTAGSITSTVSANTTSGFSVVTYTGTSVAGTVGHGLGVAPSMVIVKSRNNVVDWVVYHSALGINYSIALNSTASPVNTTSYWNSSAPTSTTFGVNVYGGNNASGYTYVAYCFAEVAGYSKFGSYIGNGVADGPFIYCGFKPAFVMFKNASSSGAWGMYDRLRAVTYNPQNAVLYPNYSNAENIDPSYTYIDFVSNGIKIRSTGADFNYISGNTYIFMAFAENPFKTSLAR